MYKNLTEKFKSCINVIVFTSVSEDKKEVFIKNSCSQHKFIKNTTSWCVWSGEKADWSEDMWELPSHCHSQLRFCLRTRLSWHAQVKLYFPSFFSLVFKPVVLWEKRNSTYPQILWNGGVIRSFLHRGPRRWPYTHKIFQSDIYCIVKRFARDF